MYPLVLFQAPGALFNSLVYCLLSQSQTLFGKLQAFSLGCVYLCDVWNTLYRHNPRVITSDVHSFRETLR